MSAFDVCRQVEEAGMAEVIAFLRAHAHDQRFVLTDKGKLSLELQKTAGDALVNCVDGKVWGIEVKTEQSNKYSNFFLETWSNRKWKTPGWMYTLKADILLYYFIDEGELFSIPFERLKTWAFGRDESEPGRIYDFKERAQRKHVQLNDTWGRCVPITVVGDEVGFSKYTLRYGEFQKIDAPRGTLFEIEA